jgi:ribosomal protein S18 acetylase RimI-like enzyme
MGSEVTVREATPDDVEPIRTIARRAWERAYDDAMDEEVIDEMLAAGYSTAAVEELVTSSEAELFVAELDGEPVGYASTTPDDSEDVGDVNVYVDPEHWGEGVGSRLLERTEEALADRGISRVRDYVLVGNDAGNAFYRSHYEKTGEREVEIGGETHVANVYEGEVGR